jgi:ribosome-binding protein aMBF1 (putative translation factor)
LIEVVTEAREAAGLSERGLSERIGKYHDFIRRVESGDLVLRAVDLWDIEDALGLRPGELTALAERRL